MAIGTPIAASSYQLVRPNEGKAHEDQYETPVSIVGGWFPLIDATGMDDADNSGSAVLNPFTGITLATRKIVDVGGMGTLLAIRMGYAGTPSTDPVIQLFGGMTHTDGVPTGDWESLYNFADTPLHAITLTTGTATDVTNGTLKYTVVDAKSHVLDIRACRYILACVKTAYAVSGGSAATAVMYGKILN